MVLRRCADGLIPEALASVFLAVGLLHPKEDQMTGFAGRHLVLVMVSANFLVSIDRAVFSSSSVYVNVCLK